MDKYLLDTHAYLWAATDPERLGRNAHHVLRTMSSQVFMSVASLWEISIKASLGQLKLTVPIEQLVATDLSERGINILNLAALHMREVAKLSFPNNGHRNPFDRMLIAQAMVERLDLVSADTALDAYSVTRVW